jgi:hypothetical protein
MGDAPERTTRSGEPRVRANHAFARVLGRRYGWIVKRAVVIGVAAAIVTLAARASAEPPVAAQSSENADPRQRAVDLSKKSRDAYRDKRFGDAVALLLEARTLAREPVLLYNLARAYEGLDDVDRALAAYEEYLREDPGARDRPAVEEKMVILRRQIAERRRTASRDENGARPPEEGVPAREPSAPVPAQRMSVAPLIVTGTGLLAIAAGAVCGVVANDAHAQAESDPSGEGAQSAQSKAESFAVAANVAFVAGGLLTAAGVTWTILELRSLDRGARARAPALRLGLGGISLEGRF